MTRPDIINQAIRRYKQEGESGISWVWFWCATPAERKSVDDYLVEMDHPLAQRASTPEYRFQAIVKELS